MLLKQQSKPKSKKINIHRAQETNNTQHRYYHTTTTIPCRHTQPTEQRLGMDRAIATTNAEERRAFAGGAIGIREAPDGVEFVATAAAAAVTNTTNTVGTETETTPNTKRKREENQGGGNTNTNSNHYAKASNREKAAATEEGGHNLNFNDDVPLPQLQAILRVDADDADDEEEEEEEIDEDNDDEEAEESNDDDGDNDDEEEEEEEGGDTDEEDDDSDEDVGNDDNDDGSSIESVVPVVPTPDEVELEYTYPNDFQGRHWTDVVERNAVTGRHHYFRVLIDPSCAEIARASFQGCRFLIEVIFRGNTLTRIRRCAFKNCSNLQRINTFPKTLQYLEDRSFSECEVLKIHLVIPKSCVLVGESCFEFCLLLLSVVFEEPSSSEHVLEIHRAAFYYCPKLRSVRLPKNLQVIPRGCFQKCTELTELPLPQSIRELGGHSFLCCRKLTSVDLPESIHLLGEEVYSCCTSLKSITIRCASSNIEFGRNVFQGCFAVSTIRMYPWLYPKLFAAMEQDPRDCRYNNLYKFVRESQYQLERYRLQHQPGIVLPAVNPTPGIPSQALQPEQQASSQQQPIIFLDIDGVLNRTKHATHIRLDPELVARLKRVVETTNATIVLSTFWRYFHDYIAYILDRHGIAASRIIGRTPGTNDTTTMLGRHADDEHEYTCRAEEIKAWLKNNNCQSCYDKNDDDNKNDNNEEEPSTSTTNFVILDDRRTAVGNDAFLQDHFVLCNTATGLSDADVAKAILILLRKNKVSATVE